MCLDTPITAPVDPYGVGIRDTLALQAYPTRPPANLFRSSIKGLSKSYGAPKATYGPPKIAKHPSSAYGAPPQQAYGTPPIGKC